VRRSCEVLIASALVAAGLTACVQADDASGSSAAPPGESDVVEAVIGDITPVTSFDATIVAPIEYQVTAWADGVLTIRGQQLVIQPVDGEASVVTFDERYQDLVPFLGDGAMVVRGQPVARVSFGGLVLRASVAPVDELRFLTRPVSARAELTGANGPFDCQLLDPVPSLAAESAFIACIVPPDVRAIAGLSGVLAVRFPGVESALTLPIAAVSGSQDHGEVLKQVSGTFVVTEVELGVSDGSRIEIVSGLAAGDVVRVPGPSLIHDP